MPYQLLVTDNELLLISQSNSQHLFSDHQFNMRTMNTIVEEGDKEKKIH